MKINELDNDVGLLGEIESYLDQRGPEDVQDMVRYLGNWLASKGVTPKRWKKGQTGLGSTMYTFMFLDEAGEEKWLAYDSQHGIADIEDNEPNPASYS